MSKYPPPQRRARHFADRRLRGAMDKLGWLTHRGQGKRHLHILGAAMPSQGRYRGFSFKKWRRVLANQTNLICLCEHMTSQRCSSCGFKEREEHSVLREGPSKCFHTRQCPEGSCRFHVALGRDSNSSRSMFRIAVEMMVRYIEIMKSIEDVVSLILAGWEVQMLVQSNHSKAL